MIVPEQLLRHRVFYAIGGILDALAVVSLLLLIGFALFGGPTR